MYTLTMRGPASARFEQRLSAANLLPEQRAGIACNDGAIDRRGYHQGRLRLARKLGRASRRNLLCRSAADAFALQLRGDGLKPGSSPSALRPRIASERRADCSC